MVQSPPPVIAFDSVNLAFDEKVVLRGVSFTVPKGRTKIILGASGSGKSTILKIIVGLLRPVSPSQDLDPRACSWLRSTTIAR